MANQSPKSKEDGKHFIAGEIAGMCASILGHPVDTLKTYIQVELMQNKQTHHRPSTLSMFRQLTINNGVRGLYKGILFPFIGYGVNYGITFGINNMFKTSVLRWRQRSGSKLFKSSKSDRLTLSEIAICGGLSGVINTFIVTPIERVKVWSQSHQTRSVQSVQTLYKMGLKKGLYRGFKSCTCFQCVSFAVYFPIYELSLSMMSMKRDSVTNQWRREYLVGDLSKSKRRTLSPLQILLSGGLAGIVSWIVGYPIDNIKTRVQSGFYEKTNTMTLARIAYRSSLKRTYQGIMPTIYRAAILHSTLFFVYEKALRFADYCDESARV